MSTFPRNRFPLHIRACAVPGCLAAPGDGGFCPEHQHLVNARIPAHVQREVDVRDLAEVVAYPGWDRVEAVGRYRLEVHPSSEGWIWYVASADGELLYGRRDPAPVLAEMTRLAE